MSSHWSLVKDNGVLLSDWIKMQRHPTSQGRQSSTSQNTLTSAKTIVPNSRQESAFSMSWNSSRPSSKVMPGSKPSAFNNSFSGNLSQSGLFRSSEGLNSSYRCSNPEGNSSLAESAADILMLSSSGNQSALRKVKSYQKGLDANTKIILEPIDRSLLTHQKEKEKTVAHSGDKTKKKRKVSKKKHNHHDPQNPTRAAIIPATSLIEPSHHTSDDQRPSFSSSDFEDQYSNFQKIVPNYGVDQRHSFPQISSSSSSERNIDSMPKSYRSRPNNDLPIQIQAKGQLLQVAPWGSYEDNYENRLSVSLPASRDSTSILPSPPNSDRSKPPPGPRSDRVQQRMHGGSLKLQSGRSSKILSIDQFPSSK